LEPSDVLSAAAILLLFIVVPNLISVVDLALFDYSTSSPGLFYFIGVVATIELIGKALTMCDIPTYV